MNESESELDVTTVIPKRTMISAGDVNGTYVVGLHMDTDDGEMVFLLDPIHAIEFANGILKQAGTVHFPPSAGAA